MVGRHPLNREEGQRVNQSRRFTFSRRKGILEVKMIPRRNDVNFPDILHGSGDMLASAQRGATLRENDDVVICSLRSRGDNKYEINKFVTPA